MRRLCTWLVCFVLVACGGGGAGTPAGDTGAAPHQTVVSSQGPAPSAAGGQPAATPAQPPPAPPPRGVAMWGESLTRGLFPQLRTVLPERQVFNGGVNSQTSTQISARQLADTEHRDWIALLWLGRPTGSSPTKVEADIAASVAALGHDRYIVVSVFHRNDTEPLGTPNHTTVVRLNEELAALYPNNFFDARRIVIEAYDPTSEADREDYAKQIAPASLRWDYVHLRDEGYLLLANRLREFIEARGW